MGHSTWRAMKEFASRHPSQVTSIIYIIIVIIVGGVSYPFLPEASAGAGTALIVGLIISIFVGLYCVGKYFAEAFPPANHQGSGNTTSPTSVVDGITVQVPTMEGHLNPTQLPNNQHSSSPTEAEVVVEKPPPPYVAPPSYDELANL